MCVWMWRMKDVANQFSWWLPCAGWWVVQGMVFSGVFMTKSHCSLFFIWIKTGLMQLLWICFDFISFGQQWGMHSLLCFVAFFPLKLYAKACFYSVPSDMGHGYSPAPTGGRHRNAALSCMGVPRASCLCSMINSITLCSVLLHDNKHGAT